MDRIQREKADPVHKNSQIERDSDSYVDNSDFPKSAAKGCNSRADL